MRERLHDKWRRTIADFLARFVSSDESHHHVVLLAPLSGENPPRAAFVSVVFARAALAPARRGRASPPPRDVPVRVGRRAPVPPGEEGHDGARTSPRRRGARCARNRPPTARPRTSACSGARARAQVNGVFRTTSELEAACPHNLRMWGLPSQEAYFAEEDERRRARAALQAVVRDPLVAPEAKHHAQASYHARWGHSTRSCRGCWLAAGHCVCARLVSVDIAPHRVVVYAHHTEFGRGSSTGVLARACLGADVLVAGHRDHEAALARLCERNEGRVAVLWPRDAVDVREFVRNAAANERECARGGEEAIGSDRGDDGSARAAGARDVTQLCAGPGKGGFVFVAVDGTWQCARKMLARLPPGIARVRVPPRGVPIGHERRRRGFAVSFGARAKV